MWSQRAGEDRAAQAAGGRSWRAFRSHFEDTLAARAPHPAAAPPHHGQESSLPPQGQPHPQRVPGPCPATCRSGPGRSPGARAPGRLEERRDWSGESLRAAAPPCASQTDFAAPSPGAWHSPDSLLMSLAGSLGAAGPLRLALCSFQYSRQCRSWEWMNRHMSQAWAAHTSSSTHSLWGERGLAQGCGPRRGWGCRQGDTVGQEPEGPPGAPAVPAPGRACVRAGLPSSTLQGC